MRDGTGIKRIFYPPAPREAVFPEPPKGLSKAALRKWMGETSGKVGEAQEAENAKWRKERVPDTQIRIEFMDWAWDGRLLGEVGDKHVASIDGAWLDVHGLHLPDGRVVHGRAVKLPDGRIVANEAILRAERGGEMNEATVTKAVRHALALAKNENNPGVKKVGAQRKETPQRIRKALRKVDEILDAKPRPGKTPTSAAAACETVRVEMGLNIKKERLQNIHSSPTERAKVGYEKARKSAKSSRK